MQRLLAAMRESRSALRPYRATRERIIKQYVGHNYSDDGSAKEVPVSLLELFINVYMQHMAARTPRGLYTTKHDVLKPIADKMSLAIDHLSEEIELGDTLRRAVLDSLTSPFGIIKVGMSIHDEEIEGYLHDVGQPFADNVDIDDWVHDMTAKRFEQIDFCGNRYILPFEYVMDSKEYGNKDNLTPVGRQIHNEDGDDRITNVSQGSNVGFGDNYEDKLELWDIWVPRHNLVITLAADTAFNTPVSNPKPLRVVEWEGPERGPYHFLYYHPVPNASMPLSPASLLLDMHELYNALMRKLSDQARRQKSVLLVQSGSESDGENIIESSDGEAMRVDNPASTKEARYGGIDPQNFLFATNIKESFVYQAGNLDALGGLSAQSQTLGQDEILERNASKRLAAMQDRMVTFTTGVMRDLGWYLWTDPLIEIPLHHRVPGSSLPPIQVIFTPEDREGDYYEYNFKLEPYSMQHQSPGQKVQTLTGVFTNFIAPFIPMLQEQGIGVNFETLLRTIAKYTDMTELEDILTFAQSPGRSEGPVGTPPRMSPVTKRINERINTPGASRVGNNAILQQLLLGGAVNQDQSAALTRSPG